MGEARLLSLEGEVTRRVGRGVPCLSDSRLYLLCQAASDQLLPMCWRGTSLYTISSVFVPIFFSGQSVVVDVEGMGIRPRAVVVGRGVVAECTRISSQKYVHEK